MEEAKYLTATNQAIWDGPKAILRNPDVSKRGILKIERSGCRKLDIPRVGVVQLL